MRCLVVGISFNNSWSFIQLISSIARTSGSHHPPLSGMHEIDEDGSISLHLPNSLPTEVWEMIIDWFSPDICHASPLADISTLRHCSLVCRAWRIRSQLRLFHSIYLGNLHSLHSLRKILWGGSAVSHYVREITLIGSSIHAGLNIFASFPTAFRGKLPNLNKLYIAHFPKAMHAVDRPMQCIPFHPFFPSLFSSFTEVTFLRLASITFATYSDFAKMINAFANLKALTCEDLRWNMLGPLPACMMGRQGTYSSCNFASRLEELTVSDPHVTPNHRIQLMLIDSAMWHVWH